ncbi:uncharacterized protein B0P05DRAFT_629267 [Gilbertella persicaria]|uniref:uncharacterized protein n=1 Tax=Gilbertella persicaria TaxID=101096 RepID=UPI0022209E29|nr:uncharacterized protein B0P05DRAFT_629267 [Gilbertella persicaria]KAI8049823.1 hypothetical protein B0P05DRAFT_629267 [Gilbertella persicaria]
MTQQSDVFLRFLPPLEIFEGADDSSKAEEWIRLVKRLKELASMNDNVILAIASSIDEEIKTWKEFEDKLTAKLMKNRVTEAWEMIKTIKQGEHQDCAEVVDILNPLFKTVKLTNNDFKVSFFIASVKPNIAYELAREKSGLKTYQKVTDKAIEIEKLQKKYKQGNSQSSVVQEKESSI